ncbi:chromatin assembly factor 1 subunit A [Varanus komodoensis]|uniref:chromatin assembly factor 1 subunit A n=1 Tax=Varanus komodoensis TaxID=61221 RepID=UPI001CF7C5AD|nr:chromatin assembly factor 1 subunit A [Varanus komodoensis]XP_044273463.1 chromatin assembly factor 1 subunit A [Varanus komodoensis]
MENGDKSTVPSRKLIQARLPFKRLNPVPKETLEANSGVKKPRNSQNVLDQNTPCPDLAHPLPDNAENNCQLETESQFVPKLVNGKGPLDNFVQKSTRSSTSQPLLVIELTGDSCHRLSENIDHGESNNVAVLMEKAHKEIESHSGLQKSVHNAQLEALKETWPVTAEWDELSSTVSTEMATSSPKESKLQNVIFERKMPIVVLEDILVARSPQAASLERSVPSGNETLESCPEVDTACTNSSVSSLSFSSSPESLPVLEQKDTVSPVGISTPVQKVSQKIQRTSEEKAKLRLQRDQERADKLQKQQAEREEKERLKAAKEHAREEAKRKKEEEKELKEKERREKKEKDEKEKAEKMRAKEEKRKERQEALEAKLEEKRKKEEEKREKEKEKRIKAKMAEITRFLHKPKTQTAPKTLAGWCGKFAPFEIKENMVLAPLCRVAVDPDLLEQLDGLLHAQSCDTPLLEELKSQAPRRSSPTLDHRHREDSVNSDVVIVGSSQAGDLPERKRFGRMKLLQFCENHRPAYWGTWNKKSSSIGPRNPWAKDEKLLDYEVESDEEWEEEEPGESLSHSEGDDDEEGGEEEDDDDGFFVPHGYLSEDEGVTEECDPENQKARQKLKAKEWDELLSKGKKFRILQPVKIGCVWESKEAGESPSQDLRLLQQFTVSFLDSTIAEEERIEKSNKSKTRNQQILGQLLPLLHGNINGSKVIIQEFQECCRLGLLPGNSGSVAAPDSGDASPSPSRAQTPVHTESAIPSKARLKRIISENSVYEKRPENRMCWYVHPEVLKSYGQEDLPVPCQWSYVTQVLSVAKEDSSNMLGGAVPQTMPVSVKRKSTGSMSITKFMRKSPGAGQVETTEMDGFQADTEEDDDDDCIFMGIQESRAPALETPGIAFKMEQATVAARDSSPTVPSAPSPPSSTPVCM